ncbi:MAG: rane fusion protein multidrug efflux system [Gammaproteobacteria bacterium]|nr:rane fusion protein multidrug efflux system [Gammaproteobacteria bacterium]
MHNRRILSFHRTSILGLVCVAILAACSSAEPAAHSEPPEVGVVTLHSQAVTITTDLPGRTAAYRVAEVRPQVSGVVLKRLFTEGGEVKAGQPLYQIEPEPIQSKLESAQASQARPRDT